MAKYRKKPVVIEAWCFEWEGLPQPKWLVDAVDAGKVNGGSEGIYIETLEGVMLARPGDWIIQGVQGEIYPCKPEIFAATYEPA